MAHQVYMSHTWFNAIANHGYQGFFSYFYSLICILPQLLQPLLILQVWLLCSGVPHIHLGKRHKYQQEAQVFCGINIKPLTSKRHFGIWKLYIKKHGVSLPPLPPPPSHFLCFATPPKILHKGTLINIRAAFHFLDNEIVKESNHHNHKGKIGIN